MSYDGVVEMFCRRGTSFLVLPRDKFSIHSSTLHPLCFITLAMVLRLSKSASVKRVTAFPFRPVDKMSDLPCDDTNEAQTIHELTGATSPPDAVDVRNTT
jgi:hypothetical protein